jgi:MFS family permease
MSSNVSIMFLNQVLCTVGPPVILILGGLVAVQLTASEAYATVPIFALQVGTAIFLLPSGRLMKRYGRKTGFLIGSTCGAIGSGVLAFAIAMSSFAFFCVGALLYGMQNAIVKQYRFAVAEEFPSAKRPMAVSMLITCGLLAAIGGPALVNTFSSFSLYVNIFCILLVVNVVSLVSLTIYSPAPLQLEDAPIGPPPQAGNVAADYAFVASRKFLIPSMLDATAFIVMTLLMTVTPIQMTMHAGCSIHDASDTIMWHLIFMYIPAFAVGWTMKRAGIDRAVMIGYGTFIASVVVLLSSDALLAYKAGLILVGVGWNWLYLTSTTLNDSNFFGATRFLAQSAHEFVTMILQCAASLLGGALLVRLGWTTLNLVSLTILAVTCTYYRLSRMTGEPLSLSPRG